MKRCLSLLVLSLLVSIPLVADEGMWMPQQIPQFGDELKARGLELDPSAFADLTGDPMGAIVSLGGCSASFVSPDGLIITNHHCVFGTVQYNSTAERDLITNGFVAKTRDEELSAGPGSRVFVTTRIEDVTDRILGKISPKLSDLERFNLIDRREKEMVKACEKPGGVRCKVSSFFEGLKYQLITQMEIRDVRLVYAPALGIGEFGGDEDNWMWPRQTGDWGFYRAYVGKDGKPADYSADNVPYHPKHWLKVSTKGVNEGDLVFVAGYPGRTYRHLMADEVQDAQDYRYPTTIRYAKKLIELLDEAGKDNREVAIRNSSRVKGYNNVLKNNEGMLDGFASSGILKLRQERDAALAKWIAEDPARSAKYDDVLDQIRALNAKKRATRDRDTAMQWLFRASPMLSQASIVYRMAWEKQKKDIDREAGYQERDFEHNVASVERRMRSIEPGSDRKVLRYFIGEAMKLPEGHRIDALDKLLAATGAEGTDAQIEKFLDGLYAGTNLDNRKAQTTMSVKALDKQGDSFIAFAAALLPLELQQEKEAKEIDGAMSRLRPLYMEALLAMQGGKVYPDANSTLRVTFGTIKGYSAKDAVWYTPQTTIEGILQKDTGARPFDSPKKLLEMARKPIDPAYVDPQIHALPVNFLSTVDTTGGNSGSPTLNAKGELIGLLFDGNYESMASDYLVDPKVTRSIHVDIIYTLWVMDAVDGAHNLLEEMGLPVHYGN